MFGVLKWLISRKTYCWRQHAFDITEVPNLHHALKITLNKRVSTFVDSTFERMFNLKR